MYFYWMPTLSRSATHATFLTCSQCNKEYALSDQNTYARCCNQPLRVEYDLDQYFSKEILQERPLNMWRYAEMLPVGNKMNIVSLGEGMTPIFLLDRLANKYGIPHLSMKDESFNPTGSFKARGLSVAVSKAKEFGIRHCIIPTAGNAGGALAAYCAKAGIACTVVMPSHTPAIF